MTFKWINLILVNREVKKNNEPDVIREAKDELNVSTFHLCIFFRACTQLSLQHKERA